MKGRQRLLQFLHDKPARRRAVVPDPVPGAVLLVGDDGTTIMTNDLDGCIREGLCRGTDSLSITPEGRAWLARWKAGGGSEAFAIQHQQRETIRRPKDMSGPERTVVIDRNESPLARLAHRRDAHGRTFIDADALEAGERLARDFRTGGLTPRVTSSWDPAPRAKANGQPGRCEPGEIAMDARARLDRALERLGPQLAGVALDVCCFEKGVVQVERDRRWPPRSAKLMLKTALDLLVRHYGIASGRASASRR